MLRYAFAALALAGLATPGAQAATLDGDTFDVSYYYPTRTKLLLDQGDFTVPSGVKIPQDPKGSGALYGYDFRYVFGQSGSFTVASFDGVVFTDVTAPDIARAVLGPRTTAGNLTAADLTYTSSSVTLNLSGVTYKAGTVIDIDIFANAKTSPRALSAIAPPSTVPLPASAPMFGAALMALGAIGYGLKRKATATG